MSAGSPRPGVSSCRPVLSSTRSIRGVLLVATAALLWGCWPIFIRNAGMSSGATTLVALLVMAAPGPFVFRREWLADRGATLALVAVGLGDAGNMALYFAALARGPVTVAVLTHYLTPLLVAVVAPFVTSEPRRWRALWAAPVSLLGLVLVLGPLDGPGSPLVTAALGAGSALFYAVIVLSAKRAGRTYSPLGIASLHAPISAVAVLAVLGREAVPTTLGPGALLLVLGAVLCGVVASILFYRGLQVIGAQAAGALTYLEPVTAATVGALAFAEPLSRGAWAGGALVLAAGLFVALEPPRPASIPRAATD